MSINTVQNQAVPVQASRVGATCRISAATLKRALTRIKPAVGTRSVIQALAGVRIYADADGGATVEANNWDTAARLTLDADTSSSPQFDTLINARELCAALKNAGKGAGVTLTIADAGLIADIAGARFVIRECKREDWPTVDFTPAGAPIVDSPGDMLEASIARAVTFASAEPTRPVLTGAFITSQDGGRIVCTDSYRLDVSPLAGVIGDVAVNVPARELALAVKNARKDDGRVIISPASDRAVIVERKAEAWRIRTIDGQFPNYGQLIPDENGEKTSTVHLPTSEALAIASGAANVLERNTPLRLTFNGDGDARESCTFTGQTPDGTAYAGTVHGVMVGQWRYGTDGEAGIPEPLEIGVNPQFFADMLKVQAGESVKVELLTPLKPFTIRDPDGAVHLLMPVRLNA